MSKLKQFSYTGNDIIVDMETEKAMEVKVTDFVMKVEPGDTIAKFNISNLLRKQYKDERLPLPGSSRYFIDKSISVEQVILGDRYIFMNGLAGEGSEKHAEPWKFLVAKDSIQWYKGYELGVVFCVDNSSCLGWDVINGTDYNGIDYKGYNEIEYDKNHHLSTKLAAVFADLSTPTSGSSWKPIIGINYDGYVYDLIALEENPVPNKPFYVRWVNDMGGFDYHMFTVSGKDTRGACNDEDSIVEVSSGHVSRTDAVTISELVLSPDIRWYDEKSGQWKHVTASQQSISLVNGKENSETGLSFVIPCENTK